MKVKANSVYAYNPCLLDLADARTTLRKGDRARVVNLPGCPRANTMGHCHVEDPVSGKFVGLVSTSSLESLPKDKREYHPPVFPSDDPGR